MQVAEQKRRARLRRQLRAEERARAKIRPQYVATVVNGRTSYQLRDSIGQPMLGDQFMFDVEE